MGRGSAPCLGVTTGTESVLRLPKRADGRKIEAREKFQASFNITPQSQSDGTTARRSIAEQGRRGFVSG